MNLGDANLASRMKGGGGGPGPPADDAAQVPEPAPYYLAEPAPAPTSEIAPAPAQEDTGLQMSDIVDPMGISFRSWRHELEDGVDTASSALPIRLALILNPVAGGVAAATQTMDIYTQATVLFYFNMDGSVTANI